MTTTDTPRSAVVTGAARGIGLATATRLVARGYRVVVTDVDGDAAQRACTEIGAAAAVTQDVRDEESHHVVAARATALAPLGVWVNNAGVGHDGSLAELGSDRVRQLIDINLYGTVWGMRAALAAFGGGEGDIVNVSSLSAFGPVPGLSTYAATKAATLSLTLSVASEDTGKVRVHAICPDGVATDLLAAMRDDGNAKALIASGGRMLSPDEVAEAVVGLVGSRRLVRTVPAWRGGMMRGTSVAPGLLMKLEPLMRRQGRRALGR